MTQPILLWRTSQATPDLLIFWHEPQVFSSPHRFSLTFKSGLCAGQSEMFSFVSGGRSSPVAAHILCHCVKRQSDELDRILLLTAGDFPFKIFTYPAFFLIHSLSRFLVPDALKHLHSIIVPLLWGRRCFDCTPLLSFSRYNQST